MSEETREDEVSGEPELPVERDEAQREEAQRESPETDAATPEPPSARGLRIGAVVVVLGLLALAFAVGRCGGSDAPADEAHAEGEDAETIWTCSMDPQVRRSEPGQCPICGMDLIPLRGDDEGPLEAHEVRLSERAQRLAQIRTTRIGRIEAGGSTQRLLGRVEIDETTQQTVTSWIGGRIDRLHVRVTGERIRRGQTVATLYSPEVYTASQDLITAARQVERLAGGSALARSAAEANLAAARQRLGLLGIPAAEITRMERSSRPTQQVAIRSAFAGTIMERLATEGTYVQTGAPLYRIADLSRLWVQLDAYESDLAQLSVGQTVELTVQALPGERFEGRVTFLEPVLDPERRTARVRVELANPDGHLRPGMFVAATLAEGAASADTRPLAVPATAPLFTGRRSVVYVEVPGRERPTYEARTVRLGPRVGDLYPVVAGLSEGERVVTRGAFALDADLQIRGGESMMTRGDDTTGGPFDDAIHVPPAFREGFAQVIAPYLDLGERLAADDLEGSREAARALVGAVADFAPSEPEEAVRAWEPRSRHLRHHGSEVEGAATIEAARSAYEPLSREAAATLRLFGNPMDAPLRLAHCPMAFDDRGAEWVQRGEQIDNAYFGRAMRTCGSVRQTIEPGSYLAGGEAESDARAPAGEHRH